MHIKVSQAFTLIELLVVISIVSLLVAILLPALSAARTTAQMATSLSNIRQLQLSQQMYANDNDGYVSPPARADDALGTSWAQALHDADYVSGPHVFWSPVRDTTMEDFSNPAWDFLLYPGYGVNLHAIPGEEGIGNPLAVNPDKRRRLVNLYHADVPPPSEFIALVEGWRPQAYDWGEGDGRWGIMPRFNGWNMEHALFTYNGGVARAYMDGHATGGSSAELGWTAENSRNGGWAYTVRGDVRYQAPWFAAWEHKWN